MLTSCPHPLVAIVDDFSDSEGEEDEEDDNDDANMDSDEIMAELTIFFGANAARVKSILKMWNAYADLYNAFCDEWTSDTDAYREERAYRVLKATVSLLELLNSISNLRHKSWYFHKCMVAARQTRKWGDLWRFSTRAVEGRGGQLKRIGRRIICWRHRCKGSYQRNIRRKGATKTITQGYGSAPHRQLMKVSCFREHGAHSRKRARLATTGRNTLVRSVPKVESAESAALPELGDVLELPRVKRLCALKHE